jgi:Transcription factor WhiB
MTASPGVPRARIMPSGRTRDGVTTSPPHPLRRGAAAEHASPAQVTRYARCADSGLDPDQWFPVSADPARARQEAAAAIAVCTSCLVQGECLVLSLQHWDVGQHGVWGGLVAADRARLRRGLPGGPTGRRGPAASGMKVRPSDPGVPLRLVTGSDVL